MPMELRWTYTIARPMACPFLACRDHQDRVMVIVQELLGPSLLRLDAEGCLVWQTTMPVPPRAEEGSGGRLITHAQWGTDQPSRLFTHEADQVFEIDAEDGAILRTVGVDFLIQALAFARLASGERLMVVGGPEGQVLAFDQTFHERWRFTGQPGPVTHCFFTHDIDGDGADEIFFSLDRSPDGYFYCLDAAGTLCWEKSIPEELEDFDDGHVDVLAFGDVDGDGHQEMVSCTGPALFDHQGQRRWLRQGVADHGQVAYLAPRIDGPGQQILIVDGWTRYPKVLSLDASGQLLWRFASARHLFNILSLDYNGDGQPEILCPEQSYRFTNPSGPYNATLLDLKGQVLEVIEFTDAGSPNYDSYHGGFVQKTWAELKPLDYTGAPPVGWGGAHFACACDIDGDGRDEVLITTWDGRVLAYGWR